MIIEDEIKNWKYWNYQFKDKKLTKTLKETHFLFIRGNKLKKISEIRNLKLETIQKQIIELITMSFINILDILEINKYKEISKIVLEHKKFELRDIKDAVSTEISWFEIKSFIASLNSSPKRRN